MKAELSITQCVADYSSYEAFKNSFPCHGDKLFEYIFERNPGVIQIKKKHVAIANLKKLFQGAFKISAKIGFHEMSLRDLSRETGVSMGSIYSCITKKDNLGVMVKDIVSELSQKNIQQGMQQPDALSRLEATIRLQFYTSCMLQPWFSFLYMETRSLPEPHQSESKQIEASSINNLAGLINSGAEEGVFETRHGSFLAHAILVMLQDWYLKPWKHNYSSQNLEQYLSDVLSLLRDSLRVRSTLQPAS